MNTCVPRVNSTIIIINNNNHNGIFPLKYLVGTRVPTRMYMYTCRQEGACRCYKMYYLSGPAKRSFQDNVTASILAGSHAPQPSRLESVKEDLSLRAPPRLPSQPETGRLVHPLHRPRPGLCHPDRDGRVHREDQSVLGS